MACAWLLQVALSIGCVQRRRRMRDEREEERPTCVWLTLSAVCRLLLSLIPSERHSTARADSCVCVSSACGTARMSSPAAAADTSSAAAAAPAPLALPVAPSAAPSQQSTAAVAPHAAQPMTQSNERVQAQPIPNAAAPAASPSAAPSPSPAAPSIPADLQAAFASLYQQLHSADGSAAAVAAASSAPALSASSLTDLFACLRSQHESELTAARQQNMLTLARLEHAQGESRALEQLLRTQLLPSFSQRLAHVRASLLDPAVDGILTAATARAEAAERAQHAATEKQLADNFMADSVTGRRLLARAHRLKEENESFESQLHGGSAAVASASRVTALESELARAAAHSQDLQDTVQESLQYIAELEEINQQLQEEARRAEKEREKEKAKTSTTGSHQPAAPVAAATPPAAANPSEGQQEEDMVLG